MKSSPLRRRIYRLFLTAYPHRLRMRGKEMEELFEDLYQEARARGGRAAAWWLAGRACAEAARRGLRARWRGADDSQGADARKPSRGRIASSVGAVAEDAFQDARYAVRTFVGSPAMTLVAIVVFALGIGANTAVFSVVEAALLRSLPFADPDRLVDINELPAQVFERADRSAGGGLVMLSDYRVWQQRSRLLEEMAVYSSRRPVLTGLGDPEEISVYPVESNLFGLLGAHPIIGRGFLPGEDRAGAPRVAVLSHAFWTSRFGQDPEVVGHSVALDGEPYEIVGIMPPRFRFPTFSEPYRALMWVPLGLDVADLESPTNSQGATWVVARLRPGVTRAQAKVELDGILEDLDAAGTRHRRRVEWRANLTPLHSWVSDEARRPLLLLLGAVGLVLTIACSNVANLLLARGASRRREMSVRMAVGASSGRLMRLVLVESLLLAATGGFLGVLVAYGTIPLVLSLGGSLIPRVNEIGINATMLVATLAGTTVAGVVAGSAPALQAGRRARAGSLLSAGVGAGQSRSVGRISGALVVAQIALSLMLLASAGLLARSLTALLRAELGFETEQIVVAEVELPTWLYPDEERCHAYARQVFDRARSTTGIDEVALAAFAPFEGGIISAVSRPDVPDLELGEWAAIGMTTPAYFSLVDIPLLRGELYGEMSTTDGNVAVIDQAAVDAFFPGQDPIGRQLATYRWRDDPLTVIGVVGNAREDSVRDDPPPHVYVPLSASAGRYLRVLARTSADPASVSGALRDAVRAVDPLVPIARVVPLRALVIESLESERFYASILAVFATTAIVMAGAGVFGVMRYAVSRRVRELGIRVALGATAGSILSSVLRRGLGLTIVGVLLGVLGAAATTRLLSSFLYDLSPLDPFTFIAASAALVGLSLVASAAPAWRATRADPLVVMRPE